MLITASTYSLRAIIAYGYTVIIIRKEMTLPRLELTISFPSIKNLGLFWFFAQVVGTPGHTSYNRDKSRKTWTYGHPNICTCI